MAKRRSDIRKLISKSREVWRQSQNYQQAKKGCKIPLRTGWFKCNMCGRDTEKIQIDHVMPIGVEPDKLGQFGVWLDRVFCSTTNLQGLCSDCHKIKGKEDRKRLK